ncbi:MAG: transcriptional repressor, partial [Clostridia bacterium]|nr:transcriptional repressor [Clostridia bacterium]
MTAKRAAILEILRDGGHLQPDEIYRRVRERYPGIVLATVYNNL